MIEEYLDVITNMENFADGIMVLDQNADVVYMRKYRPESVPLDEEFVVGKNLRDIYPNLAEEDSPVFRALKYGENTINKVGSMTSYDGVTRAMMATTFPIREDGKIIGAVNIVRYPEYFKQDITVSPLLSHQVKDFYTLEDIIGRSPSMCRLRKQIERVSRTNSSVLIYGDTGTGKEMVAQSIHTGSNRRGRAFISQNCAAIPGTLLESIFFGTVKGSYTGAENRPGIFEIAEGGTIFLDEINSMDLSMQAKLLKAIEDKRVTRVGGSEARRMDVRIVAALNEPPLQCIREKRLREDLFYRLGSVMIQIEPLAYRREDIPILTKYYIDLYNRNMDRSIQGISAAVEKVFQEYDWPGNVREFRNVIEGAFNFAEGDVIQLMDLPEYVKEICGISSGFSGGAAEVTRGKTAEGSDGSRFVLRADQSLKEAVDEYEKGILMMMSAESHNLTKLAARLGITRQALDQKMKKYGLK